MSPVGLAKLLSQLPKKKDPNLLVGYETSDDAGIYRLSDDIALVVTADFITPPVDDPYLFGQIAAANALSDIYAMGGKPLFALNIVGFPINDLPKSILTEILQGGADKAAEAGIPIVGGHSIDDKEPKYGLVVTGEVDEENMWTNSGAQPGDILILTKPLGTGIISTAIKKEAAPEESVFAAIESMSTLNKGAVQALQGLEVHAVTDVTGYGLLGHLQEMCQASTVSARIDFQHLKFFPGVRDLAGAGMIAGGTHRNLEYIKDYTEFNPQLTEVDLFLAADAQTSGGLLVALPREDAEKFIAAFSPAACQIGKIITQRESLVFLNN